MSNRKTAVFILAAAIVLLLAACATSTTTTLPPAEPTPTREPTPQVLADCFVSFQLAAWLDLDADGQWGTSEPPLEGVKFRLNGLFAQIWGDPFLSDADGKLSISTWAPGECIEHDATVTALPPAAYEPTTPVSITLSITSAGAPFAAQFGFVASASATSENQVAGGTCVPANDSVTIPAQLLGQPRFEDEIADYLNAGGSIDDLAISLVSPGTASEPVLLQVEIQDITANGLPDVLLAVTIPYGAGRGETHVLFFPCQAGSYTKQVLYRRAGAGSRAEGLYAGGGAEIVHLSDLTGNGLPDVAFAVNWPEWAEYYLSEWNGEQLSSLIEYEDLLGDTKYALEAPRGQVAFVDLEEDGLSEIVVGEPGSENTVIWRWDGSRYTPAPGPTVPAPTPSALAAQDLLALTVATDGAIYTLDSTAVLYQLSPNTLAPLAHSVPLFDHQDSAETHLLAAEHYLFVASAAISQTLVLNRDNLSPLQRLDAFGPLALEPGHRLLIIPQGLETAWPFGNFEVWAYDLSNLTQPPTTLLRHTGACLDDLAVDPDRRRIHLLTSNIAASPPHRGQTYETYDLDTLVPLASLDWERGSLTPPVVNPETGELVATRLGLNLTRRLLVIDARGREVQSQPALDGKPVLDPAGEWIYLLRPRGLWVLRAHELSLHSVTPFLRDTPRHLALSPDGQTLYLWGNGWLSALSTADLRAQGLQATGPLPAGWFSTEPTEHAVQPRLYPSPRFQEDGIAYLQLVSGLFDVLETYRSTDGGQSWSLLPSTLQPGLVGPSFLALSPDFATDQTLTALAGTRLLRSTDAGLTWQPWQSRIAFVSDRDGNRELYTVDLEGQDLQRLTASPAADENPAWSPAWTRLAFQSDRHGNWDIFTQRAGCDPLGPDSAESCDLRQLTTDPADDLLPAWSPDSRSLAFVSTRDGNPEIYVMDSTGANQRRLTFNPAGDWRPAWLPDSQHLVFTSDRSGTNDLYQIAVPPSGAALTTEPELTPLVTGPADDRDPAVLAGLVDGLLFLSDRDGFLRTYTTDLQSPPRPLSGSSHPEAHPATLPDQHSQILLSAEVQGSSDIFVAGPSAYTPLAASPAFDGHPAALATPWKPAFESSLTWLQDRTR